MFNVIRKPFLLLDGGKRSVNDADVKPPTEEDAEMAAATTASHYLGYRGISMRKIILYNY